MKKTFLVRRNALLTRRGLGVGAVAVLIVVLLLLVRVLAPGVFISILAPVWATGNRASAAFGALTAGFHSAATLAAERDSLAGQNAALALENRTLTEKVSTLEKAFGKEPADASGVIAGVLARPPEAAYDTLVVGAGSVDGVAAGMTAFAEGVPVGVVETASAHTARITLLSAPGTSRGGWVGSAHTPVTLTGKGGGAFTASVPKEANVSVGDTVFVPGPGALPVGTVERVESDPSSPSALLDIASSVNLFSLTWVLVRDLQLKP